MYPWACTCVHVNTRAHVVTCLFACVLQCNTVSDQQGWPGSSRDCFTVCCQRGKLSPGAGLAPRGEGGWGHLSAPARPCAVGLGGTRRAAGMGSAEPGVLGSQALETPRPHPKTQTWAPKAPSGAPSLPPGSLRKPGCLLMPDSLCHQGLRRPGPRSALKTVPGTHVAVGSPRLHHLSCCGAGNLSGSQRSFVPFQPQVSSTSTPTSAQGVGVQGPRLVKPPRTCFLHLEFI